MVKTFAPTAFSFFIALALALVAGTPDNAAATTRAVTSTNDSGAGTLRDIIAASAANDTLVFTVSGTITLTSGELLIGHNLTITGPGATNMTVSGNNASRVFEIPASVTVNISGLTIYGGYMGGADAPATVQGGAAQGGGILNNGTLALVNCFVWSNSVLGGKGGFSIPNVAASAGGGGPGTGGGIYNQGILALTGCTLLGNAANGGIGGENHTLDTYGAGQGGDGSGGGIGNAGTLSLTNCTLFANAAKGGSGGASPNYGNGGTSRGGAIWNGGTSILMVNCTISQNSSLGGDSQGDDGDGGSANAGGLSLTSNEATMKNTIVVGNVVMVGSGPITNVPTATAPDIKGLVTSQGHNLIGKTNNSAGWVASDLTGTMAVPLDAQLGPPQKNGGPTPTMALLASSPAIDAGDDVVLSAPYNLTTDQRGVHRPGGSHVDIGAYEFGGSTILVTTLADSGAGSLRQAILSASPGDRIIFTPLVTGTIGLTTGELLIDKQLNIVGPGASFLTISANQSSRVFHVNASGTLNMNGLTLADGSAAGAIGGIGSPGSDALGGDLLNEGSVNLSDCVITNGSALGGKGGIPTSGQAGLAGGIGAGGGIYNSGLLVLLRSTVGGSVAAGGAGTAGSAGSFGHNGGSGGAAFGAELANTGIVNLTNCTLAAGIASGGSGGSGGHGTAGGGGSGGTGGNAHGAGFSSDSGSASLTSCTISGNQSIAGNGGGGGSGTGGERGDNGTPGGGNSGGLFTAGTVHLQNTIIAGNLADTYPDVDGAVQSGGFNLVGISDGSSGWLVGEAANLGNASFPIDAKLGPLQNNGGSSPTMALLTGSPAIDQGKSPGLATDQRGWLRPYDFAGLTNAPGGDGSDIGAFELNVNSPLLNIIRSAANVVLSWPASDTGYTLQFKTSITPSVNWSNVSVLPVIVAGRNVVTNSGAGDNKFYRLAQ